MSVKTISKNSQLIVEQRFSDESDWHFYQRLSDETSIEQGRVLLERLEDGEPLGTQYRLVWVETTVTREVL